MEPLPGGGHVEPCRWTKSVFRRLPPSRASSIHGGGWGARLPLVSAGAPLELRRALPRAWCRGCCSSRLGASEVFWLDRFWVQAPRRHIPLMITCQYDTLCWCCRALRGLDLTVSDHQNYFLPLGGLTFDHGSDPLDCFLQGSDLSSPVVFLSDQDA